MKQKLEALFSLEEAAEKLGTYAKLLANILDANEIPHRTIGNGKFRVLNQAAIDKARPFVEQWKNRPRMSRKQSVPATA